MFALIFFLMGFFLGPKLNTCFQKFWATTRAMALLALGLGPPLLTLRIYSLLTLR